MEAWEQLLARGWGALLVGVCPEIESSLSAAGVVFTTVAGSALARQQFDSDFHRLVLWSRPGSPGGFCRWLRARAGDGIVFASVGPRADVARDIALGADEAFQTSELSHRLPGLLRRTNLVVTAADQARDLATLNESIESSNEHLRHASRRFETLFNCLPIACFTFDQTGAIHEWNKAADQAFGTSAFETFLNPVWDVLKGDGFWCEATVAHAMSGQAIHEREWTLQRGNEIRTFVGSVFPLRNVEGKVTGAVCANADVTEQKLSQRRISDQLATINRYAEEMSSQKLALEKANARLNELAETDGLTGLRNRRAFNAHLEHCLDALQDDRELSLILLDVDHFKQFNDRFGHVAGDGVLKGVGAILTSIARDREYAARYGGEEFALVLFGASAKQARAAAERFRRAMERHQWDDAPVTASFGVATVRAGSSPVELIEAADAALYASKRAGRNRVTHASELKAEAA